MTRSSILGLSQVSYLEKDLARQYVLYREERDARRLLISDISSMSYSPQEPAYALDGGNHCITVLRIQQFWPNIGILITRV